MIDFLRRMLGLPPSNSAAPSYLDEDRDRRDARRSAARATRLARRLRAEARDNELRVRVEVLRR